MLLRAFQKCQALQNLLSKIAAMDGWSLKIRTSSNCIFCIRCLMYKCHIILGSYEYDLWCHVIEMETPSFMQKCVYHLFYFEPYKVLFLAQSQCTTWKMFVPTFQKYIIYQNQPLKMVAIDGWSLKIKTSSVPNLYTHYPISKCHVMLSLNPEPKP